MTDKTRVLIVDDDARFTRTLSDILTSEGFAPTVASEGKAALEAIKAEPPATAVIDLVLRDISGLEVLKGVRELLSDTECIVLTGHASQQSAIEAVNLGAYSYLLKPVDMEQLLLTIRRAIEKSEAGRALRASEEKYRLVVENASEGIALLDLNGNFLEANPRSLEITGLVREEVVGKDLGAVLPKLGLQDPSLFKQIQDRLQDRSPSTMELTITNREGEKVTVLARTSLVHKDGEVAGLSVILEDITEQKRAEEELRRLKDFSQSIVENMAEGVAVMDAEGYVTFANPAMASMWGYDSDEWVGKHWTEIVPPDQHHIIRAADERRLSGESDRYEVQQVRKDGTRFPSLVSGSPRFEDGEFVGTLGVFTDITEQKKAQEEIQRRTHEQELRLAEMTALYETSLEIVGQLDLPQLLHSILRRAVRLVRTQAGEIWLYRPEEEALELVADHGVERTLVGNRLAVGEDLVGRVLQTGQAGAVEDYRTWQGRTARHHDDSVASVICAPLKWGDEIIGVISAYETERIREWNKHDRRLLALVASQAAAAIKNAGLYEETVRKAEELAALYDVSLEMASQLELSPLLDTVVERAIDLLGGFAGGLYTHDPERKDLQLTAAKWPGRDPRGVRLTIGDGVCGKVAQTAEPLVVTDYANWEGRPSQFDAGPSFNVLAVPVRRGDQLLGALYVNDQDVKRRFDDADIRLATMFANQAAIAVENARLYDETVHRAEELAALYDASLDLASQLELPGLIETIVRLAIDLLRGDKGGLYLYDQSQNDLELIAALGPDEEYVGVRLALGEGACGRVALSAEPVVVTDYMTWEGKSDQFDQEETFEALNVPIRRGDDLLGVLYVDAMGSERRFDESDIRLATLFASQAAIAIENARLMSAVKEHQSDLQRLSAQLIRAQEQERKRISQELHDELGQALTAMSINLAAMEKALPEELNAAVLERLTETKSLVDDTLDQMRDLSLELRPSMLDDLGLVPTLRWYVNSYTKRSGIEVQLETIDFEERLETETETVVYRVVQEALTNVARHADANTVLIRLQCTSTAVTAFIEDDGVGFDERQLAAPASPQRGAGLLGIRERLASRNGTFSIESRPGQGTRLTIELPLAEGD